MVGGQVKREGEMLLVVIQLLEIVVHISFVPDNCTWNNVIKLASSPICDDNRTEQYQ